MRKVRCNHEPHLPSRLLDRQVQHTTMLRRLRRIHTARMAGYRAPVTRAGFRSAGHRSASGIQYLRVQLDLITTGTDSVWVVMPSLAHKVIVKVEFSARPDGIAVTA